ncbi:hypothetical protein GW17_00052452 [Ensete ventricosum]|nr:hypothetical protein GW17_00052452 [Ensete ventricosum]
MKKTSKTTPFLVSSLSRLTCLYHVRRALLNWRWQSPPDGVACLPARVPPARTDHGGRRRTERIFFPGSFGNGEDSSLEPFYCAIMACDAGRLIAVSGGNGEEAVVKEAALPEGGRMWPELKGEGVYDAHSKDGYRTEVTDTLWSLSKS